VVADRGSSSAAVVLVELSVAAPGALGVVKRGDEAVEGRAAAAIRSCFQDRRVDE
jgi:hypothetical protein